MSEYGMAIYNPDGSVYFKTGNNTLVEIISDKVISIHTASAFRVERRVLDQFISYNEIWYDYDFSSVIRGVKNPEFLASGDVSVIPYEAFNYNNLVIFGDIFYKWNGNILSLGWYQKGGKMHRFFSGEVLPYRIFGVI